MTDCVFGHVVMLHSEFVPDHVLPQCYCLISEMAKVYYIFYYISKN